MSDRELLEDAAKAAGFTHYTYENHVAENKWGSGFRWNPLTDDGDALRLAVKLRMQIDIMDQSVYALALNGKKVSELDRADILAATRRAIVRAAAEIGRSMK